MAKASDIAKEKIFAVLATTYPESAIIDKKMYINLDIEGDKVQIAVSLTAPKTKVELGQTSIDNSLNMSMNSSLSEENINSQMKEVDDIFDFFNL